MLIELNTPSVAARIGLSRMRERTLELLAPLDALRHPVSVAAAGGPAVAAALAVEIAKHFMAQA